MSPAGAKIQPCGRPKAREQRTVLGGETPDDDHRHVGGNQGEDASDEGRWFGHHRADGDTYYRGGGSSHERLVFHAP